MSGKGKRKGRDKERELSRRDFLRLSGLATAGTIMAACGTTAPTAPAESTAAGGAAESTAAPAAVAEAPTVAEAGTTVPDVGAAGTTGPATPTRVVPRGQAAQVARNKSLILMWSGGDVGVGNPYGAGFNHQRGSACMLEPLFYYSAFGKGEIPWMAESYKYGADNKDVTIKIRNGVEWSDGKPFTARDVAFTLNMLRQNEKLSYGGDMKKWVKDAQAVDDTTLKITFTQQAPRFVYDFLMSKFDTGLFWVPEHVFKDQRDVSTFTFYDPAKGWPLVTGPYKIADWTPQQELWDLRKDWWGAKTGFAKLPAVERIVTVPFPDATGAAQAMINNEIDSSLDLRPPVMKTVVDKNPKVITHSGRDKPYGYTDWWPNSLFFNTMVKPWDDQEVRRAVNNAINRQQIVEIGYEGAGVGTELPFPEFPSLKKYFDACKPLLQKYPVNDYDTSKTEAVMTKKGFQKDAEGLWTMPDGNKIDATIYGFDIFSDYGPVLAEQLRAAGFNASFQAPPDAGDRMANGSAQLFLFGNGAAIADAYPTLDTYYHSRNNKPIGEAGGINPRWKNADFDKAVDELSLFPVGDDRGMPLFVKAMEILLRDLPAIPIVQWLHRIPYNTTYWTGWPTKDNPYVNGAFWHKTFPMILYELKATNA